MADALSDEERTRQEIAELRNIPTAELRAMAATREHGSRQPRRLINEALMSDEEVAKARRELAASAELMRAEIRRRSQSTDAAN